MTAARLAYRFGNEHNPCDPFGRAELVIEPGGAARLDHYGRGGAHRSWTGQVATGVLDRIQAAFERGGFPNTPPHPLPPDSTLRKLDIGAGESERSMRIEWRAASRVPDYAEAFAMLDAIIRQLSGDTLQHAPAGEPGMVTAATRTS